MAATVAMIDRPTVATIATVAMVVTVAMVAMVAEMAMVTMLTMLGFISLPFLFFVGAKPLAMVAILDKFKMATNLNRSMS